MGYPVGYPRRLKGF